MQISDWLSLIAICIATASVLYARQLLMEARKAKDAAAQRRFKMLQIAAYYALKNFMGYCASYIKLQSINMVNGSVDLAEKIDEFKWEIDQFGDIEMPEVEKRIKEALNKAWQMQRLLDRLAGPDPKPIDVIYDTAEGNRDGIIEWFVYEEKQLKEVVDAYFKFCPADEKVDATDSLS